MRVGVTCATPGTMHSCTAGILSSVGRCWGASVWCGSEDLEQLKNARMMHSGDACWLFAWTSI